MVVLWARLRSDCRLAPFTKKTGIKVVQESPNSLGRLHALVEAGRPTSYCLPVSQRRQLCHALQMLRTLKEKYQLIPELSGSFASTTSRPLALLELSLQIAIFELSRLPVWD